MLVLPTSDYMHKFSTFVLRSISLILYIFFFFNEKKQTEERIIAMKPYMMHSANTLFHHAQEKMHTAFTSQCGSMGGTFSSDDNSANSQNIN